MRQEYVRDNLSLQATLTCKLIAVQQIQNIFLTNLVRFIKGMLPMMLGNC